MSDTKPKVDSSSGSHQNLPPLGEISNDHVCDAVFGEITEEGPNYRNVGWVATAVLMIKTQIGLGVLSIPAAFDTLGLIPGVLCLCMVSAISTWSDYIVGVFKLRHRQVYGIDDAGALMFGRIGREFFAITFCLFWIFCSGSAMLGISIGLNSVSTHGTCTAAFVAIAAFLGFCFSSIRTFGRISIVAWIGLFCILTSILTVTIAVGIQDRPASAPQTGTWVSDYKLFNRPSFTKAVSAICSLIFAYAGTPAFFSIAAEMRDPKYYTRSLFICQGVVTVVYIAIGCVVYYYCGSYVASPALGSAGVTMKKVSYGLALPGLLATAMIDLHLPAKYIFVRILRDSEHLTKSTTTHWATWMSCTLGVTIMAYVIASAIPVFGGLVSLIGALLGTLMSFQPMGCMWIYDNWSKRNSGKSLKWTLTLVWSVFVILIGTLLMITGTYGSVMDIIESYRESGGSAAWACADNSNSV